MMTFAAGVLWIRYTTIYMSMAIPDRPTCSQGSLGLPLPAYPQHAIPEWPWVGPRPHNVLLPRGTDLVPNICHPDDGPQVLIPNLILPCRRPHSTRLVHFIFIQLLFLSLSSLAQHSDPKSRADHLGPMNVSLQLDEHPFIAKNPVEGSQMKTDACEGGRL